MNFDFGEVLSRSFQIAWKHKILWAFSALPVLVGFLIFPLAFVPLLFIDENGGSLPFFIKSPIFILIFVVLCLFISLISYVLYGISSASVLLGIVRADAGAERFAFNELLNDSKPYWWRVLGVMLLIGFSVGLIFAVIFGCMALFGAVTAGIGFICIQPFMLLMYPLTLILYGVIEISQVAVVVENLNVLDAIRRGWELVCANFWRVLLISLIVYFAAGIVSSIITFSLMSPLFAIPFLVESKQFEFTPRTMMLLMGCFGLLFFPVMALIQALVITFFKSTFAIVYLRLTHVENPQGELQDPAAL